LQNFSEAVRVIEEIRATYEVLFNTPNDFDYEYPEMSVEGILEGMNSFSRIKRIQTTQKHRLLVLIALQSGVTPHGLKQIHSKRLRVCSEGDEKVQSLQRYTVCSLASLSDLTSSTCTSALSPAEIFITTSGA
jgi:hypothetical protein